MGCLTSAATEPRFASGKHGPTLSDLILWAQQVTFKKIIFNIRAAAYAIIISLFSVLFDGAEVVPDRRQRRPHCLRELHYEVTLRVVK